MATTQIEDFLYMFRADNSSLKKGAEESTQAVKKTEQALNLVDKAANKAGGSFLHFAQTAVTAFAGVFALEHIFEQSKAAVEYAEKITRLSIVMGANVETVSAWSDAIKSTGGDSEAFQQSMQSVTERMIRIETVGKGRLLPLFKAMGVDLLDVKNKGKTALDFLPVFAKASEKMSKTESFGRLRALGVDEGTILLIQRGGKAVNDLIEHQKELGAITAEDGESLKKFNMDQADFSVLMRRIYLTIGETVLPILDGLLKGIVKVFSLIKDNGFLVESIIMGIAGAILFLKGDALVGLIQTIYKAVAGFLAMDAAALLIPLAIAAFIALIALAIQDVWIWAHGGKSAIGHYLGAFVDFKDKVFKIWDGIKEKIGGIWDGAKQHAQSFFDWVFSHFEMLMGFAKKVSEFFHLGGGNATQIGQSANGLLSAASSSPLNAITSNSITGGSNVSKQNHINISKIEVNTQATDADGISKAIGGHLTTHLRNAQDQFDDGVKK